MYAPVRILLFASLFASTFARLLACLLRFRSFVFVDVTECVKSPFRSHSFPFGSKLGIMDDQPIAVVCSTPTLRISRSLSFAEQESYFKHRTVRG